MPAPHLTLPVLDAPKEDSAPLVRDHAKARARAGRHARLFHALPLRAQHTQQGVKSVQAERELTGHFYGTAAAD